MASHHSTDRIAVSSPALQMAPGRPGVRRFRPIDLGRFCRVTSLPEGLWIETEIFHGGCR